MSSALCHFLLKLEDLYSLVRAPSVLCHISSVIHSLHPRKKIRASKKLICALGSALGKDCHEVLCPKYKGCVNLNIEP